MKEVILNNRESVACDSTQNNNSTIADKTREQHLCTNISHKYSHKTMGNRMETLTKGTILENTYEIIEEIGSGGGGIVFRAKHLRLQTDVVVKKIKDEVRDKVKSRREADILKNLKHPYLPRVYDFIETEDGVYTVMDFIHGENLDTAVAKHGRYSQKQVMKWAKQLGEALDYLHSQNPPIIHSDIKPANIMLTETGDICLIDFNIALAMGGEMGSAVGISAGFSPPEQYRDPALYARVTHNYTLQKSIRATQEKTGKLSEAVAPRADDETEMLSREFYDGGGTEPLSHEAYGDKTELMSQEIYGDETELLPQRKHGDKTELLPQAAHSGNAELPSRESGTLPKYTQFIGKGIDVRSDIYSLGVTLYYMMTGLEPSADFDQRIPIQETNIPISEGFAIILDKMMELSPDKRYQNGGEFLKAVRNCHKLDHRYIVMHRKQTGIQLTALACLALGILTVFGGLYKMRKDKNSNYYNLVHQAQEVMKLYDFEDAQELLTEAKGIYEVRIEAYEEEVYLLYLSENYEECIELGEEYINTTPFLMDSEEDEELFGNIYYIVGNAYYEMEDYVNAQNLFSHALYYNERNGLYYRDYAITLAKLGQIKEAEQQLEQGIALGLAQDSVYMAQGEIAHVKGQYDDAVEYLNRTISTTADIHMKKRAIMLCVSVYKTIGNDAVNQEIALLEQYRSQFEGNGSLVMSEYLADAYTRKAQTDEQAADECYRKALALFQSIYDSGYVTYQLQQNMAILYENMDNFDEAEATLLQMAESYPERYEVYKRLAYLEADRQQMKENAERDYAKMKEYYEKAKEKYSDKQQDMEMDMLDNMMKDLEEGGWFL